VPPPPFFHSPRTWAPVLFPRERLPRRLFFVSHGFCMIDLMGQGPGSAPSLAVDGGPQEAPLALFGGSRAVRLCPPEYGFFNVPGLSFEGRPTSSTWPRTLSDKLLRSSQVNPSGRRLGVLGAGGGEGVPRRNMDLFADQSQLADHSFPWRSSVEAVSRRRLRIFRGGWAPPPPPF